MFYQILSRLKLIKRWALVYVTIEENVAEHSWDVSVLGHLLACVYNTYYGGTVDAHLVATAGLYHDSTEALTGDLPTPIKYHNKAITKAYKSLETGASKRLLSSLPRELQPLYKDLLLETHEDPHIHRLLKTADKLAAYLKAKAEVQRGNKDFIATLQNTEEALLTLNSAEVAYFLTHLHTQGTTHDQRQTT